MFNILKDESGITMMEVLVTGIILAFALVSIYMGVLYADKQLQRNYHDRVATLWAAGQLDWETYYFYNNKTFQNVTDQSVVLDKLAHGNLVGHLSTRIFSSVETSMGVSIPLNSVEVSVIWDEPGDKKPRKIVVREDYYPN